MADTKFILINRSGTNVCDFSSSQWNLRPLLRALEAGEQRNEEATLSMIGWIGENHPQMVPTHVITYAPGTGDHGIETTVDAFLRKRYLGVLHSVGFHEDKRNEDVVMSSRDKDRVIVSHDRAADIIRVSVANGVSDLAWTVEFDHKVPVRVIDDFINTLVYPVARPEYN